jgi:hypothetical protein
MKIEKKYLQRPTEYTGVPRKNTIKYFKKRLKRYLKLILKSIAKKMRIIRNNDILLRLLT